MKPKALKRSWSETHIHHLVSNQKKVLDEMMESKMKESDEVEVKTEQIVADLVDPAASFDRAQGEEQALRKVWEAMFSVHAMYNIESHELVEGHELSHGEYLSSKVDWDSTDAPYNYLSE